MAKNVDAEYVVCHPSVVSRLSLTKSRIKNPLVGTPKSEVFDHVETYARENSLEDIIFLLKKGALATTSHQGSGAAPPASHPPCDSGDRYHHDSTADMRQQAPHRSSII